MPIRFGFSKTKAKIYKTIIIEPTKPLRVIIGHDKRFHREMEIHYDPILDRSSPCSQEDCKVCPRPKRQITYVPAWVFMGPSLQFRERILMVTKSWREVLEHDLHLWMYSLTRERPDRYSPVHWSIDKAIAGAVKPLEGFDIEPSLWNMWGLKQPPATEG